MAVLTTKISTRTLVPVVRERLADLETPVSAFAKLRALGGAFLLESVEGGERMGRYSFIGVLPRATLVFRDGTATIVEDGGARTIDYADPLDLLRDELGRYRRDDGHDLPRFSGGAVGYVGYEAARRFERLPAASRDVLRLPEAAFAIYDTVVCFDHVRHSLVVLAHDVAAERESAQDRIARVFAALDAPLKLPQTPERVVRSVTANGTPDEFHARVARARELILEGDCIQIVVSQRFDVRPAPDPLALYRALRHVNPSPYMFLLGTGGATLVGASPEPFVRVEAGRVVMHPIAGTRPRGRDEREDAANEEELRASEKERAEHVMLVDLARNDIGRVSRAGTVRVRELMRVDRFSHVMHLTSVVDGELAAELDALDAFRACFPAGTVSGAPKIRAMERIAELEPDRRGPYAGAVGYLGFDGRLDTCIAIRTAVIADGVCRIQAGAGIVADSDPAAEELETRAKARALLRAIELVDGGEARP
ncbi:MAG TPA: anthranilate synthase component I [Candidatus Limnocylindria bacterium]|jgi:anthranilate synthase component 1|nr:anthranilate synthase component I [Candidatus Limnocylindria bacterium]